MKSYKNSMMNSNIFKTLLFTILFISCKSRIIENRYDNTYGDLQEMSKNVRRIMYSKKTGVFTYPKVGYVLSLKTGKLDGEMSLIHKQDTIYYCIYKNNKPIGKYINNIHDSTHSYGYSYEMYYYSLITIDSALYLPGKGFYNKSHQKDGFWDESGFYCTKEGTYTNGLKNGMWLEHCSSDFESDDTTKIIKYKNGVVVRSNDITIDWSKGGL
jgi:hypothetical protein